MVNPIRYLALEEDVSLAQLARQAGLHKNTVYEISRSGDELPDEVYLGTLRKIAAAVGRRVVVTFEMEVIDEQIREFCSRCQSLQNMNVSTSQREEVDVSGDTHEIVVKDYHCEGCHSFVRSEGFDIDK